MMLPMVIAVKIQDHGHRIRLFIPLILFFILLLPFFLLAALSFPLLLLIPETAEIRRWMGIVFYSPKILAAARGMEVKVRNKDTDVYLRIL